MKYIAIFLISIYRSIKKVLIMGGIMKPSCKFYPTCSEYMMGSIKKYGLLIGLTRGVNRIRRCTPNREHEVDNP